MRRLVIVLAVAACSGDEQTTCASGDYECFLDHLVVSEDGHALTLEHVAQIPMPQGGGGGGGVSPNAVWAVGAQGTIRTWQGHWVAGPNAATTASLRDVSGDSGTNVYIVGGQGTIRHWNGAMLETETGVPTSIDLVGVALLNTGETMAVGNEGSTGHTCDHLAQWGCLTLTETQPFAAAYAASTEVWAAGGATSGLLKDVRNGTQPSNPIVASDVWAGGPGDVWISGTGVQHLVSGTLQTIAVTHTQTLRAITGSGNEIWVAEDGAGVHHLVLGTDAVSPMSFRVNALWAKSTTDVWAVGEGGGAAHWDGSTWTDYPTGTSQPLYGVWGSGATAPYDGGGGGGSGTPPSFTGALGGPLTFPPGHTEQMITLPWSDPTGCRPSFCFSACSPSGRCFAPARCTKSLADGQMMGTTTLGVKYSAVATGSSETFDLWITPITMPDCSQPARDGAIDPGSLVGTADKISQIVEPASSTGGGGGTCRIVGSECDRACCNDLTSRTVTSMSCECELQSGQPCYSGSYNVLPIGLQCCNTHGGSSAEGTAGSCASGGCPSGSDAECGLGDTCLFFGGEYICQGTCTPAGSEPGGAYPCCDGLVTTTDDPRCHWPDGHLCNELGECVRLTNPPPAWTTCVPQADGTARCDAVGTKF